VEVEGVRGAHRQAALDLWREQFNHERPHEALGMRTPSELYVAARRKISGHAPNIGIWGNGQSQGQWLRPNPLGNECYFLSRSLAGWNVGLQSLGQAVNVWFGRLLLGQIDPSSASFLRADIRPQKNTGKA